MGWQQIESILTRLLTNRSSLKVTTAVDKSKLDNQCLQDSAPAVVARRAELRVRKTEYSN